MVNMGKRDRAFAGDRSLCELEFSTDTINLKAL
jgi:hypothetical protein